MVLNEIQSSGAHRDFYYETFRELDIYYAYVKEERKGFKKMFSIYIGLNVQKVHGARLSKYKLTYHGIVP